VAKPDKVFKQTHDWFRESVSQALSGVPPAQQAAVEKLVWQMLGVVQFNAPVPVDPDLADFKASGAVADSLAVAAQIAAESLTALEYVKQAVDALQGGNPAAALAVIGPVLRQVDKLRLAPSDRYPSAYSLGKILLALSGDARNANPAVGKQAEKLAQMLGAVSAADLQTTQTALGWVTLITGCMIDRSFTAAVTNPAAGWVKQALPVLVAPPQMQLPLAGAGLPAGAGIGLRFKEDPPSGVEVKMNLALDEKHALGGSDFEIDLQASAGATAFVPVQPTGPVSVDRDGFLVSIGVSRAGGAGALAIGQPGAAASLSIGELGAALTLQNGVAGIDFYARKGRATLRPSGFLALILGDGIALDFDIEAQADQFGHLRLKNGTGLKATLPAPTLPTGPFKLQFINVGIDPVGGSFLHLQLELSASFGVELGPFQAAVDRFGLLLDLDINGAHPLAFSLKPPNGIGLSLDAGIVKGGGYLEVDADGGEYAGVLELKLLVVDVKAIAILNTRTDAGFSLLLLIYGQFPPVQLSFGFTLTGIGGLIAVQHTTSVTALSQGLGNGSLDAILFPANPVADAPKIINTLRVLFPIKAGGFVIGPMLELGWGTPSLVTVRLGLLIEAGQFVILGQGIVQLPPLVDADLALLRLQVDIVGSVVFDPLRIAFDAKLRNSRVAFLTLTGQFAFRAEFGDHPTFLISAGGFHPRFNEVPSDIPAPFERVGCSFDIGIVGVSFKGYFAITSATVQAGSDLRLWADIDVASIEGGWGFDAICYLAPKFYFEVDLHAFVAVHVFGEDFAAIRIDGALAGPGRWHIAGRGTVELPLVPDFHIHIDEAWGTDEDTPSITVALPKLLGDEIGKVANWSAQLPRGGEGYVTLADMKGVKDLLAHPLGSLGFQQKLIPLELRLSKVSGSKIDGANEYFGPALVLSQAAAPPQPPQPCDTNKDFFAAAQFLDMSQDDKMAKPSFEAFPAGYVLRNDDYAMGEIVPELLGYEEADLGAERVPRRLRYRSSALFSEAVHGAFAPFGAAGRSVLRDKDTIQPAEKAAIQVNPVPVTTADKSTLELTAGATVHQSVWQASQALSFGSVTTPRQSQVIELAELI
jgi:hypothetical protein